MTDEVIRILFKTEANMKVEERLAELTKKAYSKKIAECTNAELYDCVLQMSKEMKEAIAYAIANGQPGDIIVLAGKGHEDYQEIKGVKYPMDERDLIRDILEGR